MLANGEELTGVHKRVMAPPKTDPYEIAYDQVVAQMAHDNHKHLVNFMMLKRYKRACLYRL